MTPYDAAMVGVVVLGMIWGAMRGITWQIASMASLVLGYLVAFPLSGQFASHFPGEPVVARALALLATYAGVSGSIFLAAWLVRATLRQWKFEAYDRHLGMLLGGLEGAIVGLVVTLFVVSLAPQTRTPILTSPSGRVVCQVLAMTEPVMPSEIRAELAPFWNGEDLTPQGQPAAREPEHLGGGNLEGSEHGRPEAGNVRTELLRDLIEEGESRIGRALNEGSEHGVDWSRDRNVERR